MNTTIQTGHGSRIDSGNDQPSNSRGEVVGDKQRKDSVVLHAHGNKIRIVLKEHIQKRTHGKNQQSRRNGNNPIEPDTLSSLLLIRGSEVSLYHRLIGGIRRKIQGE